MTAAAESDPLAWANVVDGPHRTVVGIRLAGSDGSLFELRTMPHAGLKRCCLRMPDLPARLVAQVHFNPLTGSPLPRRVELRLATRTRTYTPAATRVHPHHASCRYWQPSQRARLPRRSQLDHT